MAAIGLAAHRLDRPQAQDLFNGSREFLKITVSHLSGNVDDPDKGVISTVLHVLLLSLPGWSLVGFDDQCGAERTTSI